MVLYVITPTLLAGKDWLRFFSANLSLSSACNSYNRYTRQRSTMSPDWVLQKLPSMPARKKAKNQTDHKRIATF